MELGAGTGVISQALLAGGIPPERLIVVEIVPELVAHLRRTLAGVHVIEGDARRLPLLVPPHWHGRIGTVVCGIPLVLLPRAEQRRFIDAIGAICPARGVGAAVIMPAANTEGMNELLEELSTQVSPGAHAAMLCDQAGWHQRGKKLKVLGNITLVPLPPYSPELNSMENVWEYLRANKLCNLVWDTYEAIIEACKDAWNFLIDDPDRIRSIGTRDWACVSV